MRTPSSVEVVPGHAALVGTLLLSCSVPFACAGGTGSPDAGTDASDAADEAPDPPPAGPAYAWFYDGLRLTRVDATTGSVFDAPLAGSSLPHSDAANGAPPLGREVGQPRTEGLVASADGRMVVYCLPAGLATCDAFAYDVEAGKEYALGEAQSHGVFFGPGVLVLSQQSWSLPAPAPRIWDPAALAFVEGPFGPCTLFWLAPGPDAIVGHPTRPDTCVPLDGLARVRVTDAGTVTTDLTVGWTGTFVTGSTPPSRSADGRLLAFDRSSWSLPDGHGGSFASLCDLDAGTCTDVAEAAQVLHPMTTRPPAFPLGGRAISADGGTYAWTVSPFPSPSRVLVRRLPGGPDVSFDAPDGSAVSSAWAIDGFAGALFLETRAFAAEDEWTGWGTSVRLLDATTGEARTVFSSGESDSFVATRDGTRLLVATGRIRTRADVSHGWGTDGVRHVRLDGTVLLEAAGTPVAYDDSLAAALVVRHDAGVTSVVRLDLVNNVATDVLSWRTGQFEDVTVASARCHDSCL